jgi:hypothetical protein
MTTEETIPCFTHCPSCHEPLYAPAPEVQVFESLKRWQLEHPMYFRWTDEQLSRLVERLRAHRGDVLILPPYAHSVNIRRPNGSVYTYFQVHNK